MYASLSTPVIVLDAEGRVLYLNPRAEAFWAVRFEDLAGRFAWEARPTGRAPATEEWVKSVLLPAIESGNAVTTPVTGFDGRSRTARIDGVWTVEGNERFAVLLVTGEDIGPAIATPPEWALRDALTGLHNLHHWQQQIPAWDARGGAVAFFDLDGLKEINDISGHGTGDRALAVTGQALAAEAPDGALVVRYGGDEFVLVVDETHAPDLPAVARRVIARAAESARAAAMSLPLHLSFGVAVFAPGGLEDAVHRADDAMYEGKGVLMPAEAGDRIVLTRAGRNLVRRPGTDPEQQRPGTFAASFGPEFDGYFRQAYARAAEQAREFVAFVSPRQGEAVVEVAAGSGRISFDGGLAERVGPQGQLLLTDPSAAQLLVARKRAQDLGLEWVRFLQAPVEDLPLASGTVGLVLGSTFLHFTDPAVALRAMARLVRPGGRVAVGALSDPRFGSGWMWALEPAMAELRARGLPVRDIFAPRAELEAAFAAAGLVLDRVEESGEQYGEYPSADVAVGFTRQVGLVRLFLRGVAEDRVRALAQVFEGRLRERFGEPGLDWSTGGRVINLLAHRPG